MSLLSLYHQVIPEAYVHWGFTYDDRPYNYAQMRVGLLGEAIWWAQSVGYCGA